MIKKTLLFFLLFWVLTFPFYKGLITPFMITSDDLDSHATRLIEFDKSISDGHFPVRIFPRTNFGLGYAFLIFNYPLVYYFCEIFYKLGFNPPDTLKLIMILSFPLSGFFAFIWLKNKFNILSAILGAMIYTIIPVHFVNVYIRGAMGEIMALTIAPLGFYFIDRLIKKPNILNSILTTLSFSAVLLLHNVIALYFLPIFVFYFLIQFKNIRSKKLFFIFLGCLFWTLLICSFYLIPLIIYKPLVRLDLLRNNFLESAVFPDFKDLIYMKWGFGGPKQNFGQGEMSLQLGILQQIFFIASMFLIILHIKDRRNVEFYLASFFAVLFIVSVFLMLKISFPIWQLTTILQYQEFPWRLLSLIPASSGFLTAYTFEFIEKKLNNTTSLLLAVLLISILVYLNRNFARPEDYYVWKNPFENANVLRGTGTYRDEHLPLWHSKNEELTPHYPSQITSGNARIVQGLRKTNLHEFNISVYSESTIVDRTDYFPGWTIYANGKKFQNLDPYSKEANGLIAFRLKPGNYKVEVKLEETFEEKIADILTLFGLILIPVIFIKSRIRS